MTGRHRSTRHGRVVACAAVALAVIGLVTVIAVRLGAAGDGDAPASAASRTDAPQPMVVPSFGPSAQDAAASGGSGSGAAPGAPAGRATPAALRIPVIGVSTPLVDLGLDATGALAAPDVNDRAGWFTGGPAPGEPGPAVLAGHVDSKAGPAVFFRLKELRVGDAIEIDRSDGSTVRFRVTSVAVFPKDAFPTADVYGPTPVPELRLVTCGGPFDRAGGRYLDNVIVHAVPL